MSYRNSYRVVISNEFLGVSKEISAPDRYELDRKVENQKRIWQEKVKRELVKQNKEQMKSNAESLSLKDKNIMAQYEQIIKHCYNQSHNDYYNSLLDYQIYKPFSTELEEPNLEQIYEELQVPKKSFLEKIFRKRLEKRLEKEAEANNLYGTRRNDYDNELLNQKKRYEKEKNSFVEH